MGARAVAGFGLWDVVFILMQLAWLFDPKPSDLPGLWVIKAHMATALALTWYIGGAVLLLAAIFVTPARRDS